MGLHLSFVILGRKADLVIPSSVRKRARIHKGDVVEVVAIREGEILLRKADDLAGVREMIAGRLFQWPELEGRADELLNQEAGR